jgi:transposase InsO family protein
MSADKKANQGQSAEFDDAENGGTPQDSYSDNNTSQTNEDDIYCSTDEASGEEHEQRSQSTNCNDAGHGDHHSKHGMHTRASCDNDGSSANDQKNEETRLDKEIAPNQARAEATPAPVPSRTGTAVGTVVKQLWKSRPSEWSGIRLTSEPPIIQGEFNNSGDQTPAAAENETQDEMVRRIVMKIVSKERGSKLNENELKMNSQSISKMSSRSKSTYEAWRNAQAVADSYRARHEASLNQGTPSESNVASTGQQNSKQAVGKGSRPANQSTGKSKKNASKKQNSRKSKDRRKKEERCAKSRDPDSSDDGSDDSNNDESDGDDSPGNSSSSSSSSSDSDRKRRKKKKKKKKKKQPKVPDFSMVDKIAKKITTVHKAADFPQFEKDFANMMDYFYWDKSITDAKAKAYDGSKPETDRQRKKRIECFMVLKACMAKEHSAKWDSIVNGELKGNAQGLYRKIVSVFSLSGTYGSAVKERKRLQHCTMASTGLAVENYGLKFIEHVKALIECGGKVDEKMELIPMYLQGLSTTFKEQVTDIEKSINNEEGKFEDLFKVQEYVQKIANLKDLANVKSMTQSAATKLVRANAAQMKTEPECYSCGEVGHVRGSKKCKNWVPLEEFKKNNPKSKKPCKFGDECKKKDTCPFVHSSDRNSDKKKGKKLKYQNISKIPEVKLGLQTVMIKGKEHQIQVESDTVLILCSIHSDKNVQRCDQQPQENKIFLEVEDNDVLKLMENPDSFSGDDARYDNSEPSSSEGSNAENCDSDDKSPNLMDDQPDSSENDTTCDLHGVPMTATPTEETKVDDAPVTKRWRKRQRRKSKRPNSVSQHPVFLQNAAGASKADHKHDASPIVDSGAMVHSVTEKVKLTAKKEVKGMHIAGIHGQTRQIKEKGTWRMQSSLPRTKLNIQDVYVVPDTSVNLLSVGKFDDLGLRTIFDQGRCTVSDRRGVTLLQGVKEKGLYRVKEQKVDALSTHITRYDASSLLRDHERLGHRAFSTVRKLLNYPKASRESLDPVCEACQFSQMKDKKIPREALSVAPRYGFRLCSDTSNKKPAANAEGKTGLQRYVLSVDEYTNTMFVDFIQRKSNAKFSVIKLVDSINTERQAEKVAEHQSDGGTEWVNKKLDDELAARGVTSRNSSPHCQYQNGVAESAMDYVEKTYKAMMIRGKAPDTDWVHAVRETVYLHDILPNVITGISPYEKRNGMAPRETPENLQGVIFCKVFAKLYRAGKMEHKAIAGTNLGKDPRSPGTKVRPVSGKVTGKSVRVGQVVEYDVTNFPNSDLRVPKPDPIKEIIYDSDSDEEIMAKAKEVQKKKGKACKAVDKPRLSDSDVEVDDEMVQDQDDDHPDIVQIDDDKNEVKVVLDEDETPNTEKHPEGWIPGGKIGDDDAYEIETIVDDRWNTRTRRKFREYKVKWIGDWPVEWIPASSIRAPTLVTEYWRNKKMGVKNAQMFADILLLVQEAKLVEGGNEAMPKLEATVNPFRKLFDPNGSEPRLKDPKGYNTMLKHKHAEYFIEAIIKEKLENKKWKAYVEVPRSSVPDGIKILKPVTVYTTKYNDRGEIEKFKCRVCLDGSKTDVDPKETYETMCGFGTVRLVFCLAARFGMSLVQTDIKNFYLQARLPEGSQYYAEIPDGWAESDPKTHVAKVLAPWYGLREASKVAGDQFAAVMEENGMIENKWMPKLFSRWIGDNVFIMCAQHSDDGIWATTSIPELDKVLDAVNKKFELVRNYKPAKMLGAQIEYDQQRGILKLHQGEYWKAKIKELGIPNKLARSPGVIPQKVNNPLFEDKKVQASDESIRTFQRHVGVHIWGLQTDASAAFVTTRIASGMVNPQKYHWDMLARLEAYKSTYPEMGLVFRRADPPEVLKRGHSLDCLTLFADADLAGDLTDSKSTSGYSCHLGESGMFDWKCKKQTCVCQSSCEAETLSNKLATCTAIWLRNGLSAMEFTFTKPSPVCQDNQSAIALCESDKHHSRSRHFRMHVHFLKDCQAKRITCYPWVPTKHMRGDLFNKVHGPIVHERLLETNQMSPYPIHVLDAKPKPLLVDGWRERHAEEKAADQIRSQPKATKPNASKN